MADLSTLYITLRWRWWAIPTLHGLAWPLALVSLVAPRFADRALNWCILAVARRGLVQELAQ